MVAKKTVSVSEFEELQKKYNALEKRYYNLSLKNKMLNGEKKALEQFANAMQDALSEINVHVGAMRSGLTSSGVKFTKEVTAETIQRLIKTYGFKNTRNLNSK